MDDCFSRLGLPRKFDIDPTDLEDRYLRACMSIHPDHLHGSGSSFVSAAELSLGLVNRAYEILKDPVSRADHLLVLSGGPTAKEHKTVSPGFLELILELRESMIETSPPSQWSPLEDSIKTRTEEYKAKLPSLCSLPMNSSNEKSLREHLNEIAFLETLERDLRERTGKYSV